jgi:hypothetical protein
MGCKHEMDLDVGMSVITWGSQYDEWQDNGIHDSKGMRVVIPISNQYTTSLVLLTILRVV